MSEEILEAFFATFDELGVGVFILLPGSRVLFANQAAKTMLEKGWPVRIVDGCLQGRDRLTSVELRDAIDVLCTSQNEAEALDHQLCLAQSSSEQPGAVGCLRRLASISGSEPAVALYVAEAGPTHQYGIDALAEAYGLSKAETRILKALIEAQTPAEVAARLNIAISTVKSHLRKIFQKTNTSRQNDLLRLVECSRTPFHKISDK